MGQGVLAQSRCPNEWFSKLKALVRYDKITHFTV